MSRRFIYCVSLMEDRCAHRFIYCVSLMEDRSGVDSAPVARRFIPNGRCDLSLMEDRSGS